MQKPHLENSQKGFVLPDLCADQSLLLLLMAAQLVVIAFVVFQFGFAMDWAYFGQVTLYVQWQVVLSVLMLCKTRLWLASLPKYGAASIAYGILMLIALLIALAVDISDKQFDGQFVARNLVLSLIINGLALRYLYIQQQVVEREKAELQASLSALQAKIKPHFLFNTINSIVSLISIAPEKAEQMVMDLAELLRASLRDNKTESTIADEWHLCERYLAIEQLRFGERLVWSSDFHAIDTQLPIPALSLQPLVENAIYHGIQTTTEPGFIKVCARQEQGQVVIEVINSKQENAVKPEAYRGNRMAVDNIRLRIARLYGASAKLTLRDEGERFVAELSYQPDLQKR